jgi:HTH-type transcriptional regulator/antitoxin HigA
MDIHPLNSEAHYDAAIEDIEHYFIVEPQTGSAEADRFNLLSLLIADYEAKYWPIEAGT